MTVSSNMNIVLFFSLCNFRVLFLCILFVFKAFHICFVDAISLFPLSEICYFLNFFFSCSLHYLDERPFLLFIISHNLLKNVHISGES